MPEKENLNTAGFFEPTEKYIAEHPFEPKLWFNVDLIMFTVCDKTDPDVLQSYKCFCDFFEVKITIDEVFEKLKDYLNEDFDKIMEYLIKNKP